MNNKQTNGNNEVEQMTEMNPLMAAYNPEPAKMEEPRFYWQEPWQDGAADADADKAVQSAFEG